MGVTLRVGLLLHKEEEEGGMGGKTCIREYWKEMELILGCKVNEYI